MPPLSRTAHVAPPAKKAIELVTKNFSVAERSTFSESDQLESSPVSSSHETHARVETTAMARLATTTENVGSAESESNDLETTPETAQPARKEKID